MRYKPTVFEPYSCNGRSDLASEDQQTLIGKILEALSRNGIAALVSASLSTRHPIDSTTLLNSLDDLFWWLIALK
jgi:hypothetical protein